MKLKPEKKITIESNKRFSESYLWEGMRNYFDQQGVNAWVDQVPFYVTSNPHIANCYANIVIYFIRDWIKKNPNAKSAPFYLMELGTGSGRFSFYVLKKLRELKNELGMNDVKICYIMSDFTESNLKFWQEHPALQLYKQEGMVDFAIYNMENDDPIKLVNQNITLTPENFVNPLVVFANYIFDTVSHDIFSVHNNKLHEVLLTLTTEEDNMRDGKPIILDPITIDFNENEIGSSYYSDEVFNKVINEYKDTLTNTNFLFPVSSLRAINKLRGLTGDKLMVISSDKGYSTLESLDYLGHPTLAFHGSFSMMVNFHAIARYFKLSGGDYFLQTQRKGIKTSVFYTGIQMDELPETRVAIQNYVEGFSPADYFMMHRRMRETYEQCDIDAISAHMALSDWDPYIFNKINSRICSQLEEADGATVDYFVSKMPNIAANFHWMPKVENTFFDIGVFYHTAKRYDLALEYYTKSEPYCIDNKFSYHYNLGICNFHTGNIDASLENFKLAHEIDADSQETKEWISYIEDMKKNPSETAT